MFSVTEGVTKICTTFPRSLKEPHAWLLCYFSSLNKQKSASVPLEVHIPERNHDCHISQKFCRATDPLHSHFWVGLREQDNPNQCMALVTREICSLGKYMRILLAEQTAHLIHLLAPLLLDRQFSNRQQAGTNANYMLTSSLPSPFQN